MVKAKPPQVGRVEAVLAAGARAGERPEAAKVPQARPRLVVQVRPARARVLGLQRVMVALMVALVGPAGRRVTVGLAGRLNMVVLAGPAQARALVAARALVEPEAAEVKRLVQGAQELRAQQAQQAQQVWLLLAAAARRLAPRR